MPRSKAKRCACGKRIVCKGTLCHSCRHKRNVAADPVAYSYRTLRKHATERGKVFTITLEYFRQFCIETPYMTGKGRTATSYHVDRIREELGYIEGNLQVLQNGDNVWKFLNYDWQTDTATVVTMKNNPDKDLPF